LLDQLQILLFRVSAQQIGKGERDGSFIARAAGVENFVKLIVIFGD
jgi:hypothetical protein